MLLRWRTLPWACNAPSEYESIPPEAVPRPGRGLAVSITEIVLLPTGPRLSTFARFITWKYRPYRPGSSLLKLAHIQGRNHGIDIGGVQM